MENANDLHRRPFTDHPAPRIAALATPSGSIHAAPAGRNHRRPLSPTLAFDKISGLFPVPASLRRKRPGSLAPRPPLAVFFLMPPRRHPGNLQNVGRPETIHDNLGRNILVPPGKLRAQAGPCGCPRGHDFPHRTASSRMGMVLARRMVPLEHRFRPRPGRRHTNTHPAPVKKHHGAAPNNAP